ncbi:transglycosylase SLT domain-containing protein [Gulosibacter massiliensis]|uniref:aggregation-promoting factor C-terminal-like domain-containing protein n=1 Tax=Gulosibacter massiliensis TaxID=2479839 RepID=UPI000F63765D|nr:transglycosylase SLT domain-containing protein [Gulosibacter massiliensis]
MTEITRSGSTRAAVPWAVRSSRRNRKVTSVVAGCALAAVAAVGIAQPFLAAPAATQAAESYQPSLADITKANPQSYVSEQPTSGDSTDKGDDAGTSTSITSGRSDVTVELEPEPEPEPEPEVVEEDTTTTDTTTEDTTTNDSTSTDTSGASADYVAPSAGSIKETAASMASSQYGWGSDQFACLDSLWTKESNWNPTAANASGAYGIPQALPGSKMSTAGSDWATNPSTQIAWGLSYISDVYGTPCAAWGHSQSVNWY